METREFQTEARQLLDLMIHSVYSNKDIFLRELISNASDALDKLRYESLTNSGLEQFTVDPHIRIESDPAARTITVSDNGIGMDREEVIRFIGTIAKSGTLEYARLLQDAKSSGKEVPADLIGQFGVGFYSSFMVADKVTLITRRAGQDTGVLWESTGDGKYTIGETNRFEPGTSVTLHLKQTDDEDGVKDYTREWTIREIVKHYSDFVSYPIRMKVQRKEIERDEDGKPREGAEEKTIVEDETLNSQKAIWTRPEKDVSDEDYNEFYKHISHDWSDPLKRVIIRAEGTSEFRALIYIPARAPFDLFTRDFEKGIHLYIKRVFIMSDAKDLVPEYLRFLRGVVDSEDLSLNVSREILQKDRHIATIRKAIVRKLLDTLKTMRADEKEKFATFWKEFGRVLKEGLFQDQANRDALLEICGFASTESSVDPDVGTTLEEYVARMKPDQNTIYYMTGPNRAAVESSPHLEAFRDQGYEVLILTDPVDEVWTQSLFEHKGKRFQSVGKGTADIGSEEDRKKAEQERKDKEKDFSSLLEALKSRLDEHVKEVRLSGRLTSSPACLVGEAYDMSPQMEQLMRASGQEVPKTKRILELNPGHPLLEKLQQIYSADSNDARLGDYAELLYGQSVLAEGGQLPDPGAFSRKVANLMTKAL
ncbi:MAG: molecular chaperone HtpG [Candidatus Sumerlaeaceae bacterium]